MRHAPTPGERKLWSALTSTFPGAHFRRQYPLLGRFIADFVAPSRRLIIEVDGHAHIGRQKPDARRERALERAGYRVVRLDELLVVNRLEEALAIVRKALNEQS